MSRKTPKTATLRLLFSISGNECAMPSCAERIIDDDGDYVGEVCHIEAAEPGGQRYNDFSDDESRRLVDNLMLLCLKHHKKTDDVEIWTVEKLRAIKADHERPFREGIDKLVAKIRDETLLNEPEVVTTAKTWNAVLDYDGFDPEHLAAINTWAKKLSRITLPSRELLVVVVGREGTERGLSKFLKVDLTEVQRASGVNVEDLLNMVRELRNARLLDSDFDDDYRDGSPPSVYEYASEEHGVELYELREFCKATGISPEQILVDLELSVFD